MVIICIFEYLILVLTATCFFFDSETLSVEYMINLKNSIASHGPDVIGLHLICIPYLDAILEIMKSKGSTNSRVAINNALRKHSIGSP